GSTGGIRAPHGTRELDPKGSWGVSAEGFRGAGAPEPVRAGLARGEANEGRAASALLPLRLGPGALAALLRRRDGLRGHARGRVRGREDGARDGAPGLPVHGALPQTRRPADRADRLPGAAPGPARASPRGQRDRALPSELLRKEPRRRARGARGRGRSRREADARAAPFRLRVLRDTRSGRISDRARPASRPRAGALRD